MPFFRGTDFFPRSLGDRVRVASYVVALLSDAVRFFSLGDALRSKLIGDLGVVVGVLGSLVRQGREDQAAQADGGADDVDDDRGCAAHGSSSVGGGASVGP